MEFLAEGIRLARRADLPGILPVMNRAFFDDPTARWYQSDIPETFALEHHGCLQLCAEAALDHSGVHTTIGQSGAAIRDAPDVSVSEPEYARSWETLRHPDKTDRLGDLAEACDIHRPNEPHGTLELLAVDPRNQSHGIGRKLMTFGPKIAGRSGVPTFLASSNPKNLSSCERLGFVRLGEGEMPGMPSMFPMPRKPVVKRRRISSYDPRPRSGSVWPRAAARCSGGGSGDLRRAMFARSGNTTSRFGKTGSRITRARKS